MKQRNTKKTTFKDKTFDEQYEQLAQTEYRVQRMQRIIEDLLVWKEGSAYYKEAVDEYKGYCDE
tara:strand:+ start:7473 stop:7664 length:192 start_codon:yes stop_codon:yes gene_type:complete